MINKITNRYGLFGKIKIIDDYDSKNFFIKEEIFKIGNEKTTIYYTIVKKTNLKTRITLCYKDGVMVDKRTFFKKIYHSYNDKPSYMILSNKGNIKKEISLVNVMRRILKKSKASS